MLEYKLTVSQRQFQGNIADNSTVYRISIESNLWYVTGKDLDKDLRFRSDQTGRFKAIKVDPETLFEHSFGIILPHEDQ